jgi:hypothetical protein
VSHRDAGRLRPLALGRCDGRAGARASLGRLTSPGSFPLEPISHSELSSPTRAWKLEVDSAPGAMRDLYARHRTDLAAAAQALAAQPGQVGALIYMGT